MKKLTTTALLAGAAILAAQSGFAQSTFKVDHLYLGFQNKAGLGTADYIINLGAASGLVGGSSVIDLSTSFSLSAFNAVLGGSSSLLGGVVGGNPSSTAEIYLTQLRSGGAGIPSVPGSSLTATPTRIGIQSAITTLGQVHLPSVAGTGTNDPDKTWEAYVEPANTASTFIGNAPNPDWPVGASSVVYEDLWYATNGALSGQQPYTYQGYFTLDLTGGGAKLTFTPKNAPAPLTQPVFQSVSKTGGTVTVVSGNAVPTHSYQLRYSASLTPPSWNDVGSPVTANSTTVTNTDTTAGTSPQRFYQVKAQ